MQLSQRRMTAAEEAVKLRDEQRVQLGHMAKQICPAAVEIGADGRETKIDVDALDPPSFLKLDMYVRRLAATANAAGLWAS